MPKLIGRKIGMTRVIQPDGEVIPVTVISVPNAIITQVKTEEHDGYHAVVLGVEPLKKPTKTKKFAQMKEFRLDGAGNYEQGKEIGVELLDGIEQVSVQGVSKGRGFAGVLKRWNFGRGPETHGSNHHREPGSSGTRAKPGRIHKGKKFPGRYGNQQFTRHHVPLVVVDKEQHVIAVKGAVAGANGGVVYVSWV